MSAARFVACERWHCQHMASRMRAAHREGIGRVGLQPAANLLELFERSYRRHSVMIDNDLAVIAGVAGSLLSSSGFVWAAVSENGTRYPVTMVRALQHCLDDFMIGKDELVTTVIDGDDKAMKLAIFLGFHVTRVGFGQRAWSRAGRRMLADFIADEPKLHHPAGNGAEVAMGVQAGELH